MGSVLNDGILYRWPGTSCEGDAKTSIRTQSEGRSSRTTSAKALGWQHASTLEE